jgi:osmoprotectant transport system ATP-binding protein
MEQNKVAFCIVLDQEHPIGYVTKKEIKYEKGPVKDVVKKFPMHLRKRFPARDALSNMLMHDFRTLCVVDAEKKFQGTITYDDIQDSIRQSYKLDEIA